MTFEDINSFKKERIYELIFQLAEKYDVYATLEMNMDINGVPYQVATQVDHFILKPCTKEEFLAKMENYKNSREKLKLASLLYLYILALDHGKAWAKGTAHEQEVKTNTMIEDTMKKVREVAQASNLKEEIGGLEEKLTEIQTKFRDFSILNNH